VSVAATSRPRPERRAIGLPALLAATVLATAGGATAGALLTNDREEPAAVAAQPRIGLQSGVARLPLPPDWEPLGRRSTLPGFEQATAVRGVHGEVALDIRAPERASLLPASVEAKLPERVPEPRTRRLGVRTVWRYDLAMTDQRVVALALPTTGGVVTIACAARAQAVGAAGTGCERAAEMVRLDGASALPPAPETAAAIVLPEAIALLNRRRRVERRRLAATRSPRVRSAAARRLARSYAVAAARLRPVAAGDAVSVTAVLDRLARDHRALATAGRRRAAAAQRRAGARIERRERRLGALLAAASGR
jgi:hypothetical protein